MYVNTRHFASKYNSKSLSIKNTELWKIIWNIANKTYKLDIPQHIKDIRLTAIFYLWKLHLAPSNAFPSQILKSSLSIFIDSGDDTHNKWKVQEVVNSCKIKRYGI